MRELLYLSEAKLRSFSLNEPRRFDLANEIEVTFPVVGGGARIGPTTEPTKLEPDQLLEEVLAHLARSPRRALDITSAALEPGAWAKFEATIYFGHFHRDKAEVVERVVLFRGAVPDLSDAAESAEWPERTEFLLGGWVGHMREMESLGPWSQRMGSATDDIYRLWSEVAELDRHGSDAIPDEFPRLEEIKSSQIPEPLSDVICSIYGMSCWHGPTHPDASYMEQAYVSGIARVLRILPPERYYARLVLGTPLYVEYAPRPVIEAEVVRERFGRLKRWLSRVAGNEETLAHPELDSGEREAGGA